MKSLYFFFAVWFIFGAFKPCEVQADDPEQILLRIANRARESQSDAVLIVHNGRAIFEYRSDPYWQPIDSRSITKSVVALSIGLLIQQGKIPSIDTPVYQFYPEWDQGNKRLITIRHLLNQTSGLQNDYGSQEIYNACNTVQLALCAELSSYPGSCYAYNNKAVNLLSGIVEKASGQCLSEFTRQNLFEPMEIENFSWQCDPAHHDYAMAHLTITAPDLAKIGDLVSQKGFWRGQQIVNSQWIDLMTNQGHPDNPFSGYLWWLDYHCVQVYWDEPLLKQYECAGISPEYIQRLRSLQGQLLDVRDRVNFPTGDILFSKELMNYLGGPDNAYDFYCQVNSKQVPQARWSVSGLRSYSANGYEGQQLIVYPSKQVIAVRQIRHKGPTCDSFPEFGALVEQLIYCQGY